MVDLQKICILLFLFFACLSALSRIRGTRPAPSSIHDVLVVRLTPKTLSIMPAGRPAGGSDQRGGRQRGVVGWMKLTSCTGEVGVKRRIIFGFHLSYDDILWLIFVKEAFEERHL